MGAAETLIQTALVGEAVDDGPAIVLVLDEDGRYLAVNAFACHTLGYTREELLRLRVADVARGPETSRRFEEMRAQGALRGTALLTRKDTTTVEFDYRAARTRVAGLDVFVAVGFVAG